MARPAPRPLVVAKNTTRAPSHDDYASLAGIAAIAPAADVTCGTIAGSLCPESPSDDPPKGRDHVLSVAARCLHANDTDARGDARAGLLACAITDDAGLRADIQRTLVEAHVLTARAAALIPARADVDARARRALVREGQTDFDTTHARCRAATPRGPDAIFVRCEVRERLECAADEALRHVIFEVRSTGCRLIGVGVLRLGSVRACE
jgi:hypothetical protein